MAGEGTSTSTRGTDRRATRAENRSGPDTSHKISPNAQKEIALTFDDGPHPIYTVQVLDILRKYHILATFFCVGQNVKEHPKLLQREHREGHIIGNHTWSHPVLTRLSADAIRQELSDTSSMIQKTVGIAPKLFRPPYGKTDPVVKKQAEQLGMTEVLWTVDPRDWDSKQEATDILDTVLNQAVNGAIVLLHDFGKDRSPTVYALRMIIPTLQKRGFRFVTIPQLYANRYKKRQVPTEQMY